MKRYYLCQMVEQPVGEFYPAIHFILDPRTGKRAFSYAACSPDVPHGNSCLVIATGDHRLAVNAAGVEAMPDYSLDSPLPTDTALPKGARLPAPGRGGDSRPYGDLILAVGRGFDQNFHIDKFDVMDG